MATKAKNSRVEVNQSRLNRYVRILGPGIITGAADDDPSGIATYSQTGAQFGLKQLWTAPYLLPLLFATQEACGRIGAVTGKGLAGVVKLHYSKKILAIVVLLVVSANTINIGADLGAISSASQLVVNIPFQFYAIGYAALILFLEIFVTYRAYAKMLKWLALALLAYPITALIVPEPWGQIVHNLIVPHIEFNFAFLFIITGVFGTTISPYMFFWQASGEVEEEIAAHRLAKRGGTPRISNKFLRDIKIDTLIGMLASEVTQAFIIITTATVLFNHGITNIATASDAAKALEPLVHSFPNSGQVARDLFAVGVVGLGLLAIPVLAGSAAYALAEAVGWKEGLYRKFSQAAGFYTIIIFATLIGLSFNFVGIDPIKALVFTAVFNGVAAVPLCFIIARINGSEKMMGKYRGGLLSRLFVWITFVAMAATSIAMFWTLAHPQS